MSALTIVLFVVGIGLLVLGADLLVRGASRIALAAGISPLVVGLTVVAFGTSAPEMAVSVKAAFAGQADIAYGNVVGSNIFNIGVILGLTALLKPIRVQLAAVRRDLLVAVGAALVPWLALPFAGYIPRPVGIVLLALLVTYLTIAYRSARQAPPAEVRRVEEEMAPALSVKKSSTLLDILLVVAGLGLLVLGSRGFVDAAIGVARQIGWSELFIGLTLVAFGTSLPELVTSLVAMKRGDAEIAVGNVIGSNIFNAFGIVGVCATVAPQAVNHSLTMRDTPVMLLATLALLPIMRSGGRISRLEGALLLGGYIAYVFVLFRMGG